TPRSRQRLQIRPRFSRTLRPAGLPRRREALLRTERPGHRKENQRTRRKMARNRSRGRKRIQTVSHFLVRYFTVNLRFPVAADVRRRVNSANGMIRSPANRGQSGRGQPHSKTLTRRIARHSLREVLECGCPLPLSLLASALLRVATSA